MARFMEPSDGAKRIYEAWVIARPPLVRAVAERFDPWSLYRLKSSGHRVTIYCFDEDAEDGHVTLQVDVSAAFNCVLFERRVFGVPPEDIEPCELPTEDDMTGALLRQNEVEAHLPMLRAMAGVEPTVED